MNQFHKKCTTGIKDTGNFKSVTTGDFKSYFLQQTGDLKKSKETAELNDINIK